mgnify:CR=1 FL=1|jgi:AraC-like DNA-binding protein
MFDLKYAAPSPMLAEYISAFYLFESDEAAFEEIERADVAQLRFMLAGQGELVFGPGRRDSFCPLSLIGPRNKASRIVARGPARLFGLGLLPAGWLAVTSTPAHQLADQMVDGFGPICGPIEAAHRAIEAAASFEEMVAAAEAYMLAAIALAEKPPLWLIHAVDEWLETSLAPDVSVLLEKTGLSNAQAQRQLKAIYGAPPKLLARKYRALRTAVRIANGEGDWQDYIGEAYYDQSHCIREIKAFAGVTPAAIKRTPRLTKATFERRKLKGRISKLTSEI